MPKQEGSYRDKQLRKQNQMAKSKSRKKSDEGKKTEGNQEKLFQ